MKTDFMLFRSVLALFLCISLLITPLFNSGLWLFAQDVDCEKTLNEAEQKYTDGRFDDAINLITQCLDSPALTQDQKQRAYRLMGLTYIAKDYLTEAKKSVQKLLELVPNYKPDPIYDPPPFVNLVDEVRSERIVAPSQAEEKKSSTKWWLIGGGVGIVAVAAVLLLSGGEDGAEVENPLPGPPDLP